MRPDGVLVTPFTGTEAHSGMIDADCVACERPPSPECLCGIHYMCRARDIIQYAEGALRLPSRIAALQHILDGEWLPVLTYGVAVGAVEVDQSQYQNAGAPSRRAGGCWRCCRPARARSCERRSANGTAARCRPMPRCRPAKRSPGGSNRA
jgi:hypothetical protein